MNKPVAYWDGKHFASKDKSSLADIPLYTHPVKELTDEEIHKLWLECWDEIEFAKAILRKAQEK